MVQVFISYGRQDAAGTAQKLADFLRSEGYLPWLDVENGIPLGAPFDVRIEHGIANSAVLIALLSPWSLRPEGFCRNELLFAQAKQVPIVPVRIADVIPPIQIISLNYIDAPSNPETCFPDLHKVIEEVRVSRQMPRRDWPAATEKTAWWADFRQLDFQEELGRLGGSFVGRAWLLDRINAWLKQPDSRLLLLSGEAGLGKSALVAQLTTKLNVRGVHFCSRSNLESCRATTWLRALLYQLAAQFPAYRQHIGWREPPAWNEPPEALFRTLLADPLRSCQKELPIDEPWVFLLDALDESLAAEGPALIELLAEACGNKRLPPWWRIIATTRPDQTLLATLKVSGVTLFDLAGNQAENQADTADYIAKRWADLPSSIASWPDGVRLLAERAAGNFLFAKIALDALADTDPARRLTAEDLQKLPGNLGGIYHEMFRKRFQDEAGPGQRPTLERYAARIRPLLEVLVAARAPLPEPLLRSAARVDEPSADQGFVDLSQFLSRGPTGVQLFHRSLADWLKDKDASVPFAVPAGAGSAALADALNASPFLDPGAAAVRTYRRAHLAAHLAEVGRWQLLLELLHDPEFALLKRWTEQGEGDEGIVCLSGLLRFLESDRTQLRFTAGLATQLARLFSLRNQFDEARSWLAYALERTSWFRGRRERAIAVHELASLHLYRGDYDESARSYGRALRLCRWGWPIYHDEASANWIGLATVSLARLDFSQCVRQAGRGMQAAQKAGDQKHYLAGARLLATSERALGQHAAAESRIDTALMLASLAGVPLETARLLMLRGWLQFDRATLEGQPPTAAAQSFAQALKESERLSHHHGILDAAMSLGWCHLLMGELETAGAEFERVRTGLTTGTHAVLWAGHDLGRAALSQRQGNLEDAATAYRHVAEFCKSEDLPAWGTKALVGTGALNYHRGEHAQAEIIWQEALKLALRISPAKQKLIEASIQQCKTDPCFPPR